MTEAWTVQVKGRVQGVGFRYSAYRQAALIGISGWVRNEYDGSVRLFIQGENEQIARYLSWLSQGPPLSHVTDIIKTPSVPDEQCTLFEITF